MKKSIRVKSKKRGRPATGKDPLVGARLPPALIAQLDAWASRGSIGRSEAMRRLLERALASESQDDLGAAEAQKASELADRTAERLVNKSMPPEEQQRRKRALIKGPKEFREICDDLPKDRLRGQTEVSANSRAGHKFNLDQVVDYGPKGASKFSKALGERCGVC